VGILTLLVLIALLAIALPLLLVLGVLGFLVSLVRPRPRAVKVCPRCGLPVWLEAARCPRCGYAGGPP
jgi:ribosomal protein L40E